MSAYLHSHSARPSVFRRVVVVTVVTALSTTLGISIARADAIEPGVARNDCLTAKTKFNGQRSLRDCCVFVMDVDDIRCYGTKPSSKIRPRVAPLPQVGGLPPDAAGSAAGGASGGGAGAASAGSSSAGGAGATGSVAVAGCIASADQATLTALLEKKQKDRYALLDIVTNRRQSLAKRNQAWVDLDVLEGQIKLLAAAVARPRCDAGGSASGAATPPTTAGGSPATGGAGSSTEVRAVLPGPGQVSVIGWRDNLRALSGFQYGPAYAFKCPPLADPAQAGQAWGTDLYTADSSMCTAAVHAGKASFAAGGMFTITAIPGAPSFTGTTRNGVATGNYGSFPAAIQFS